MSTPSVAPVPGHEILDDSYDRHVNTCRTRYIEIHEAQTLDSMDQWKLEKKDSPALKNARAFFLEKSFNEMQKLVEASCSDETKRRAILQHLATKEFDLTPRSDGEVRVSLPPVLTQLLGDNPALLDGLIEELIKGKTLAAASIKPDNEASNSGQSSNALDYKAGAGLNQLITWKQKKAVESDRGNIRAVPPSAALPEHKILGSEAIAAANKGLEGANQRIQPAKEAALSPLQRVLEKVTEEEQAKANELEMQKVNLDITLKALLADLAASDEAINAELASKKDAAKTALLALDSTVGLDKGELQRKLDEAKQAATLLVEGLPTDNLKEELTNALEGNQTLVKKITPYERAAPSVPNLNRAEDLRKVLEPEIRNLRTQDKPATRAVASALEQVIEALDQKEKRNPPLETLSRALIDLTHAVRGEEESVMKIEERFTTPRAPRLDSKDDFLKVIERHKQALSTTPQGTAALRELNALADNLELRRSRIYANERSRNSAEQLGYAVNGEADKIRKIEERHVASRVPDLNSPDDLAKVSEAPLTVLKGLTGMPNATEAAANMGEFITSTKALVELKQRNHYVKHACENLRLAAVGDVKALTESTRPRDSIMLNTADGFKAATEGSRTTLERTGLPEATTAVDAVNKISSTLGEARIAQENVWHADRRAEDMRGEARKLIYKEWLDELLADQGFRTDLSLALSLIRSETPAAEAKSHRSLTTFRDWAAPMSEVGHYDADGIFVPVQGDYAESMRAIQEEKRLMDASTEARGQGGQKVLLHRDEIRAHLAEHVAGLEVARSGLETTRESVAGEVARVQADLGGQLETKGQEITKKDGEIARLNTRATEAEAAVASEKGRADGLQEKLTKSEGSVASLQRQLGTANTATNTANEANRLMQLAIANAEADLVRELAAANGVMGSAGRAAALAKFQRALRAAGVKVAE